MYQQKFWWAVHNVIAHPVSEVLHWVSLFGLIRPVDQIGHFVHDWTVPTHGPDQGRG